MRHFTIRENEKDITPASPGKEITNKKQKPRDKIS